MTVSSAPSFGRSVVAGDARSKRRPTIYYIRHGLTDWNVAQRLQGRHDVPLNAAGHAQATCCAAILQDLFRREGRAPESFDYVSSPLVRARETMEIVRAALGLAPAGYAIAGQLAEIAFGEWEGLTYAQVMARDKQVIAARESDKWSFAPPRGESYAQVAVRIRQWYDTVARDTVVAAHGGTARALIAHLGLALPQDAAHYSIDQGVVYLFARDGLTRHG
jgi:broad specificity phosphatase PhoE